MTDRLLTTAELAEWLGVTPETIRSYRESLGLPFLRISASVIRFRESEILQWLEERNRGTVLHLNDSLRAPDSLIDRMTAGGRR